MKLFRQYLALALLILFEIAAGVLLLIEPAGVAATVLFLFGIVMVVIGGMNLVRFFREKPDGFSGFVICLVGVAAFAFGVFSLIPSTQAMLLHYVAILYALIFFVAGLYEAQMYFSAKKALLSSNPPIRSMRPIISRRTKQRKWATQTLSPMPLRPTGVITRM